MYNHSVNKPRAPDPNGDDAYGFNDQAWAKFGVNTASASSTDPSQSSYASRPSFNSSLEMDWAPTASTIQTSNFAHQGIPSEDVQFENMSPPQDGGGVGRLVAHFENKGYAPPLPPRPSTSVSNQVNAGSVSSPFGSFNVAAHNVPSPLASPDESNYGFMDHLSRVASPIASPPPMSFGGFFDPSRVSSPVMNSSAHFGSMDSFAMDNRVASPMATSQMVTSPMVTSPMVASPSPAPGVPGTPGFAIWRPPVPMTPKPTMDQSQNNNSGGFFKPPIPSTPKPVMNAGSQFILDFNANTKAKGKAPARPALKQPSRRPSTQQLSIPTPPVFSPASQPEVQTPQISQPSSSTLAVPVRAHTTSLIF